MAKYLCKVSYTQEGAKGVLKEGGTGRRKAVEQMLQGADAKIDAFYYALGEEDAYLIVDVANNVSVAAISMVVAAGGGARITCVPLLTPDEIDQASKRTLNYRPPGA